MNGTASNLWASLFRVTASCAVAAVLTPTYGWYAADSGEIGMSTTVVRVRVGNRSDVDFDQVVVKFPSQEEAYGRIPASSQSDYRQVAKAYRYAQIEVTIHGKTIALRPMDYVGEEPLAPGNYTYALSYDSTANSRVQLQLSLVVD
jgi:hypothetical protein